MILPLSHIYLKWLYSPPRAVPLGRYLEIASDTESSEGFDSVSRSNRCPPLTIALYFLHYYQALEDAIQFLIEIIDLIRLQLHSLRAGAIEFAEVYPAS